MHGQEEVYMLLTVFFIIAGYYGTGTDFQTVYYLSVSKRYQCLDPGTAAFLPEILLTDHYIPEKALVYADKEPFAFKLMVSLIMAAQGFLQDVVAGHLGQPLTHHSFVLLKQLGINISLIRMPAVQDTLCFEVDLTPAPAALAAGKARMNQFPGRLVRTVRPDLIKDDLT